MSNKNLVVSEPIARYFGQENALRSKILNGQIDPEKVRPHLQSIIEGKAGETPATPRRSPATYFKAFAERNESHFKVFDDKQLYALGYWMNDHLDPLRPITVSFSLGKGFEADYDANVSWLADALAGLKDEAGGPAPVQFTDYLKQNNWTPSAHANTRPTDKAFVKPVYLDYRKYWDKKDGHTADGVWAMENNLATHLPLLEPLTDAALNPEHTAAMDGEKIPHVIVSGVRVDSGHVLHLYRDSDEVYLRYDWSGNRWYDSAFAAFSGIEVIRK